MEAEVENNQFYEIWDTEIPEISPRSTLYRLSPVGIGTAAVESLSGYISRLAQEHSLSPVVLLKNSVRDLSELPKSLLQNSISSAFAGSLNGFSENTGIIVDILQKATLRDDIYRTTLIPWKNILSKHKLLKKHSAWCPVCFDEQKRNHTVVYEKLLWSFNTVNAYHIHELPLAGKCPHCRKKSKVLSGRSRPGYCSGCLKWLGSNLIRFDEFRGFRNDGEKKKELWKAVSLGELLEKVPLFSVNYANKFIENLRRLIQINADGNINDFAHRTGMWHISLRRLLKGEVLPTVEMTLRLCFPLEISPTELFERYEELRAESLQPKDIETPVSKEAMKIYLEIFMKEHPPPSANEVFRRTGWSTLRIQRNFPAEYKQIVSAYDDYTKQKIPDLSDNEVERILIDALREKPPPSLQSVFRRTGCRNTGYRYYQKFPELCAKIAARYKKSKLKKFNLKKAKRIIELALSENPPPSFSEVARRLECTRENIRKKLPELSKALNDRYTHYLKTARQKNIQELHYEVKKVLINLQEKNTTISMNKVKKILPRKWNDKNFKMVYRQITEEMNLKTEK